MIDCSKTTDFLREITRMCHSIKCSECPFYNNNGTGIGCDVFMVQHPEKSIEIVQKWSDEHPQKTYLSESLKNYPNAKLRADRTPQGACLYDLGLISKDDCRKKSNCVECWNQPVEEDEN